MDVLGICQKLRLPAVIVAIVLFLIVFRAVVWPFLAALALSVLLEPAIRWFERRGAGRQAAVVTVFLILSTVCAAVVLWIVPSLIQEINQALARFPRYAREFEEMAGHGRRLLDRLPGNVQVFVYSMINRGESFLRGFLVEAATGLLALFSRSLPLLLVPILSFYMSRDLPSWRKGAERKIAFWLGKDAVIFQRSLSVVGGYVRGQILDSMAVGGLLALGLLILKVDLALLIGALAGVFNLIPYFGPVIGAAPALILAGLRSPWKAFYVILLFFTVNQLETAVLVPRLVGKRVGLHPVAVIFLLLFGGKYLGFFGMLLAVPIGAVLQVLLRYYLDNERTGR